MKRYAKQENAFFCLLRHAVAAQRGVASRVVAGRCRREAMSSRLQRRGKVSMTTYNATGHEKRCYWGSAAQKCHAKVLIGSTGTRAETKPPFFSPVLSLLNCPCPPFLSFQCLGNECCHRHTSYQSFSLLQASKPSANGAMNIFTRRQQ